MTISSIVVNVATVINLSTAWWYSIRLYRMRSRKMEPLRLSRSHGPLIPANISGPNGTESGWMLVDTGASCTIVNRAAVNKLGLKFVCSGTNTYGGGVLSLPCGIYSASIKFPGICDGAFDLSVCASNADDNEHLLGVVGRDVLEHAEVSIKGGKACVKMLSQPTSVV